MRNTADSDPADTASTEMELPVLDLKKKKTVCVSKCKSVYHIINVLLLTVSCVFPLGLHDLWASPTGFSNKLLHSLPSNNI